MKKLFVVLAILFVALVPALVLAQAPEPSPAAPTLLPPDYSNLAAQAINALVVIAVPVLVYLARVLIPKIPKAMIPFVALAAGNLLAYVTTLATDGHFSVIVASLLGAAGLWLRELVNTLKEHGAE